MTTKFNPVIFCDFDGTITMKDNIINIMAKFAPDGWEAIKDDILAQRVSIQKGVSELFSLLPTSQKEEIVSFVLEDAKIREGFGEFVQFTREQNIPLYIVSGGIDFFVHQRSNHSDHSTGSIAMKRIFQENKYISVTRTAVTNIVRAKDAAAVSRQSFANTPTTSKRALSSGIQSPIWKRQNWQTSSSHAIS